VNSSMVGLQENSTANTASSIKSMFLRFISSPPC
jgi:hypothetical protein